LDNAGELYLRRVGGIAGCLLSSSACGLPVLCFVAFLGHTLAVSTVPNLFSDAVFGRYRTDASNTESAVSLSAVVRERCAYDYLGTALGSNC